MKYNDFTRKLSLPHYLTLLLGIFLVLSSCRNENRGRDVDDPIQTDTLTDTVATSPPEVRNFTGDISTVNTELNTGREVTGTVNLRVEGELMRIVVTAEGLSPDMMHLQHLQATEENNTGCPTQDADANNDGIIDISELSGTDRDVYMIPLHMGPSSLELDVDTYPSSNINGELQFQHTISLDSLRSAVRKEYGMQDLDFTRFTYVIQGVAQDADLPQSVRSISNLESYASIPVGCAELIEQ